MTVYALIEMENLDVRCCAIFAERETAMSAYKFLSRLYLIHDVELDEFDDWAHGTIAFAGDDAYSVQLIERELN